MMGKVGKGLKGHKAAMQKGLHCSILIQVKASNKYTNRYNRSPITGVQGSETQQGSLSHDCPSCL